MKRIATAPVWPCCCSPAAARPRISSSRRPGTAATATGTRPRRSLPATGCSSVYQPAEQARPTTRRARRRLWPRRGTDEGDRRPHPGAGDGAGPHLPPGSSGPSSRRRRATSPPPAPTTTRSWRKGRGSSTRWSAGRGWTSTTGNYRGADRGPERGAGAAAASAATPGCCAATAHRRAGDTQAAAARLWRGDRAAARMRPASISRARAPCISWATMRRALADVDAALAREPGLRRRLQPARPDRGRPERQPRPAHRGLHPGDRARPRSRRGLPQPRPGRARPRGNPDAAIADFTRAIELDPSFAAGLSRRAATRW